MSEAEEQAMPVDFHGIVNQAVRMPSVHRLLQAVIGRSFAMHQTAQSLVLSSTRFASVKGNIMVI